MTNRREFLMGAGALAAGSALWGCKGPETVRCVPFGKALRITGTFLDEISHDIPHQNWGEREWDADFGYMKAIGIDTVIMIRCGHRKFITYPSKYLLGKGCHMPSTDLVDMFLRLADKHGMSFYFGLYDPGKDLVNETDESPWLRDYTEANLPIIEEVWKTYGHHKSFKGWYLSAEFAAKYMRTGIDTVRRLGRQCKDVSGGRPTFISPWINGKKAVSAFNAVISKKQVDTADEHAKKWNEIFDAIHEVVDACAFQDGHVDFEDLDQFLTINKTLCGKYGIASWTNTETFDRDMPIKFLPIKFDKLRMKLEAAGRNGYEKAITFEFSHFMSPQSVYSAAGNLYNRYREYFGV